ncbi:hypothetical protein BEK98_46400 [Streptomyces diastatochromogenes]|uniref:Transposase IS701-like DDE domain-containing protein n=1 Tax=Streptomyces diastatochromogenes TaxID=42236 RepID=A0A233RM17_STRDA|nr:hypothetical protein BEK98_46400 [Streptomyces diastatochromogenes]
MLGLLADLPRKSSWTIAEWARETIPHGMQHPLCWAEPQYTGTAGRIENSQVAVYLVYARTSKHAAWPETRFRAEKHARPRTPDGLIPLSCNSGSAQPAT